MRLPSNQPPGTGRCGNRSRRLTPTDAPQAAQEAAAHQGCGPHPFGFPWRRLGPGVAFESARVLTPGAPSGIGAATAEAFCKAGAKEVIVTGRRDEKLRDRAPRWWAGSHIDVAAMFFVV